VDHQRNQEKSKKKAFLESNEKENTTSQNLCDTAKVVLREKFITMSVYIEKLERDSKMVARGRKQKACLL
jgi:hypothetical protein